MAINLTRVENIALLKKMQSAGHITFHRQTGTKITGLFGGKPFTCFYIDEYKNSRFEFQNKVYYIEYVSGCFMPYVYLAYGENTRENKFGK